MLAWDALKTELFHHRGIRPWLSLREPRFSPKVTVVPHPPLEVSLNLALARIASSTVPLLLPDKDLAINAGHQTAFDSAI